MFKKTFGSTNNKTAHISWLDQDYVFGSLSHQLIPYVMKYYHIPETIITYIRNLYTRLEDAVETESWTSETSKFKKGAFQGDPYSGIIFLLPFNPIIQYIKKHNDKYGYQIQIKDKTVKTVITTPFADDFNIISRNIKHHQKLLSDLQNKINSIKLVLKPHKCRSLSIQHGMQSIVSFYLTKKDLQDKVSISSVIDEPLKFLGSEITKINTPNALSVLLETKLENELSNVEKSSLRGQHKIDIYSRYALPSRQFYLSVHHINKVHKVNLDKRAESLKDSKQ